MFKCLIVDDEAIARKGIEKYIAQIESLTVAGAVRTAMEANDFLKTNEVDIMVLDIEMPQLTGLDFLKALSDPPVTIIITAYPDYALQGFELDVIDYIVKPASFERVLKACNKAKEYLELKSNQKNERERGYFFVKVNGKIEKIFFDDIFFIEAQENYSSIHTRLGKFLVLMSLKNMEASLDNEKFMRVHKSFIVSLDKITGVGTHMVSIGNKTIPLGRNTKKILLSAWKRND